MEKIAWLMLTVLTLIAVAPAVARGVTARGAQPQVRSSPAASRRTSS